MFATPDHFARLMCLIMNMAGLYVRSGDAYLFGYGWAICIIKEDVTMQFLRGRNHLANRRK